MAEGNVRELLEGKDEAERALIAQRVGAQLCYEDLSVVELRAAEALARLLVADAIERVRQALSEAVKTASHLPRDVALKIAHDVDSVSCPFLMETEVFSEEDWRQLVMTISRTAKVAVACRKSMSEGLAVSLAELGDSVVAQALVDNMSAPMSEPVCDTLIDRFTDTTWVLDKLATRDDLLAATAAKLIEKVSSTARNRLVSAYGEPATAARLASEAEFGALLSLIRDVPTGRMMMFVRKLRDNRQLSYELMLAALRDGSLDFFETAVALIARLPVEKVRTAVSHGNDGQLMELLSRAEIPNGTYAKVWDELRRVRSGRT